MPNKIYDVPVCQKCISALAQFAERMAVNHEAIGLTPTCRYFTPFHYTLKTTNPAVANDKSL